MNDITHFFREKYTKEKEKTVKCHFCKLYSNSRHCNILLRINLLKFYVLCECHTSRAAQPFYYEGHLEKVCIESR